MKVLIKNAIIIDKNSSHHLQRRDILVFNGTISKINEEIVDVDAMEIKGADLYCTIGLCDIGTHLGEPGLEHRETIFSLTKAARRGGYTSIAVFSNEAKPLQNASDIEWIKNHKDKNNVNILPLGALSSDTKGSQMVDYMDLQRAGVVGFSDGLKSIEDTGLLLRVMEYTSVLKTCIIHHPSDKYLKQGGLMHEGVVSTGMGLKGIPDIAELNTVQRDVLLSEYLDRDLILHALSSDRSLEAIKEAKGKEIKVSATVAYLNLIFSDEAMSGFDTHLKVKPVLRSEKDKKALINHLENNTIDAIVSNHVPLEEEAKKLEFPYALSGAIGLETCLVACVDYLSDIVDMSVLMDKLTRRPRELLNQTVPQVNEGCIADICVFDKNSPWVFNGEDVLSVSKNSPFTNHKFKTKVIATLMGDDVLFS